MPTSPVRIWIALQRHEETPRHDSQEPQAGSETTRSTRALLVACTARHGNGVVAIPTPGQFKLPAPAGGRSHRFSPSFSGLPDQTCQKLALLRRRRKQPLNCCGQDTGTHSQCKQTCSGTGLSGKFMGTRRTSDDDGDIHSSPSSTRWLMAIVAA